MLIDPERSLEDYSDKVKTYVSGEEMISQFVEMVNTELDDRNKNGNRETKVIFIDKFDLFLKQSKIKEPEFIRIFETAPKAGIHLFIAG